jgi:hypothetical protein
MGGRLHPFSGVCNPFTGECDELVNQDWLAAMQRLKVERALIRLCVAEVLGRYVNVVRGEPYCPLALLVGLPMTWLAAPRRMSLSDARGRPAYQYLAQYPRTLSVGGSKGYIPSELLFFRKPLSRSDPDNGDESTSPDSRPLCRGPLGRHEKRFSSWQACATKVPASWNHNRVAGTRKRV